MFDLSKVETLLLSVGGLVIIVLGIVIVTSAKKAKNSEVASTALNGLIGIVFMAVGAGALTISVFGKKILDTFGIGG